MSLCDCRHWDGQADHETQTNNPCHNGLEHQFRDTVPGAVAQSRKEATASRSRSRCVNRRRNGLVDLLIAEGKLTLHVRGADKLWAFKSSLEIPLVHIAGVRTDPEVARGWYHGIRM